MKRKITKKIYVGDVPVGGGSPITIQSMTNTDTKDVKETVKQILELEKLGCDIIRAAITSKEDAIAIPLIKEKIHIPFIADVQYSKDLAILAVENGCDCLRINPGNIGGLERTKEIVEICKKYKTPIRVGANSGSVHQEFIDKFGGVNSDSIVESAMAHVKMLENMDFYDIKVAVKSSDVNTTIECYEKLSKRCDYPLHVGITEAGPVFKGAIKSAVGIGAILQKGIGDTIRVSLTGDPKDEIKVGKEILKSLGLLQEGIDIISCPTCARTKINLIEIVNEVEKRLEFSKKNIKVAIMGCPVNGPGEAKEADIGIAGSKGRGLIFKKGEIVRRVNEDDMIEALIEEIDKM